jgi:RNA polymerase sigma factor (sigma-70 family)
MSKELKEIIKIIQEGDKETEEDFRSTTILKILDILDKHKLRDTIEDDTQLAEVITEEIIRDIHLGKYNNKVNYGGYIFTVIQNNIKDESRKYVRPTSIVDNCKSTGNGSVKIDMRKGSYYEQNSKEILLSKIKSLQSEISESKDTIKKKKRAKEIELVKKQIRKLDDIMRNERRKKKLAQSLLKNLKTSTPEEEIIKKEECLFKKKYLIALDACINQLTEKQHKFYKLRFPIHDEAKGHKENLSNKEIAKILTLSPGRITQMQDEVPDNLSKCVDKKLRGLMKNESQRI